MISTIGRIVEEVISSAFLIVSNGNVPDEGYGLARYLAKYVTSPSITMWLIIE